MKKKKIKLKCNKMKILPLDTTHKDMEIKENKAIINGVIAYIYGLR